MVAPDLKRCEMIDNRKLKSGTKLWARYKEREYRAKVVAGRRARCATGWRTAGSSGLRLARRAR
jgi:hypothetical protein